MRAPIPALLSSGLLLAGLLCTATASIAASAGPAAAETADALAPMSAEQFDALSVGRTLTYATGGMVYGTEQYLPGRRVLWAFTGDICKTGSWFPQGDEICFRYEGVEALQCWTFYDTPGGLSARFRGDPDAAPLVAVGDSDQPLACLGPQVGV